MADDRALRDALEQLQVRTKELRAQLEGRAWLQTVRAEVVEQLAQHEAARARARTRLSALGPQVEQARLESMWRKWLRAEQGSLSDLGAAARMTIAIAAAVGAAFAGAHFGDAAQLPVLGSLACALGAGGFVAVVWRMGADLRR